MHLVSVIFYCDETSATPNLSRFLNRVSLSFKIRFKLIKAIKLSNVQISRDSKAFEDTLIDDNVPASEFECPPPAVVNVYPDPTRCEIYYTCDHSLKFYFLITLK